MQFWESIINTALIGTDKKQIGIHELPHKLAASATLIIENTAKDKEEKFLQLAALTFNYRQCGVLPVKKELPLVMAPEEDKAYCNGEALQVLKDILSEESIPLLRYWLNHCYEKQQIILPELVPTVLAKGAENKKLQYLVSHCCGKRGEWLGKFNPVWNFSSTQEGEELWLTGTSEQRKEVLRQVRNTDPAKAREWIQQTWKEEDAATKTGFLEIMEDQVSDADIPFLEGLAVEKGKKVKETTQLLLKKIPASSIVKTYEEVLRQSVTLRKEKALLGLMSKWTLHFSLPDSMEAVFKSGIEKLSNVKELTDDEFILYQLVRAVPVSFWEKHLEQSPAQLMELFQKDPLGKKLMPALAVSITHFKDSRWAQLFKANSQVFYLDIMPLLKVEDQESYSIKFFDDFPDSIIQIATGREAEWSRSLTMKIFRYAARNPYRYHRAFFSQHIQLIPVDVIADLEKCAPEEPNLRSMWATTSEYISKLVTMKIQTIKAFNK